MKHRGATPAGKHQFGMPAVDEVTFGTESRSFPIDCAAAKLSRSPLSRLPLPIFLVIPSVERVGIEGV